MKPSCPLHSLSWACLAGTTLASLPPVDLHHVRCPICSLLSSDTVCANSQMKMPYQRPAWPQNPSPRGWQGKKFLSGPTFAPRVHRPPKHFVGSQESPSCLPSLLLSILFAYLSPRAAGQAPQGPRALHPHTLGMMRASSVELLVTDVL